MRQKVREIVRDELLTLPQLASLLDTNPVQIHKYVVEENICEHERIGKSLYVIDRKDLHLVKDRVIRSKSFKANRKAGK